MAGKLREFVCSRQIECLITVKAANVADALAQLPATADDLAEQADGVAFATLWAVQLEDVKGDPALYDDDDVAEAKATGAADFVPGDD